MSEHQSQQQRQKDPSLHPVGDARNRRPVDSTAGGEDSSPLENVPSGEKAEAAEQSQSSEQR